MIVTRRAFALGTAAATLAGCTLPTIPKPQYQDSLAGLHNLPASSVPMDVPAKAGPTVALVLGANVEKLLQYREDHDKVKNLFTGDGGRSFRDEDPQYLVTGAVQVLRQHYPHLDKAEDLATAARQRFSASIVLDAVIEMGQRSGLTTTASVTAVFFDSKQAPISRIEASGQATVGYPWIANLRAASDIALAGFREKVDRYWS